MLKKENPLCSTYCHDYNELIANKEKGFVQLTHNQVGNGKLVVDMGYFTWVKINYNRIKINTETGHINYLVARKETMKTHRNGRPLVVKGPS